MNRFVFALPLSIGLLLFAARPLHAVSPTAAADTSAALTMEEEILSHQETELSLLGKSRMVLLEALSASDTVKARRVLDYMKGRFDTSRVVAFLPGEELFIAYWMREYETIFAYARTAYTDDDHGYERKLLPQRDLLYLELKKKSQHDARRLADGVKETELSAAKKDFLFLFLKYLLTDKKEIEEETVAERQELNAEADDYIRSYPDAEFTPFVRRSIRFVTVRSNWGLGYELGLGYLALPSALSTHLKDFGLLTMTFETAYRDLYAGIRIDIGAAHNIRKGFTYNGTWKDGLQVMQTGVLLSAGPMLELGNNFVVTPQAGIGYYDFSPPEDEKKIPGNDVSLSFGAWALGTNFDIPLSHGSPDSPGGLFLRLNVSYRTAMTDLEMAKGGYIFFTIGVDFFGRPVYREL